MKKISVVAGLAVALALPSGALAKPTVDKEDRKAAIAECKAERGKTKESRRAFKAKYKSMSRCVRKVAVQEAKQEEATQRNASKECKAEAADPNFAADHDGKTFAEFYGTGNGKNAHGKCVSGKVKAAEREDDEEASAS